MKFPVKTTVAILVLGIGGYVGFRYARSWWKARSKPHYRQTAVARGGIVSVVNATGTIQPVLRVQVGTFVSGPIRGPKGAAESLWADTTDTRIMASYDGTTGVLTLSGPDSAANYERVLRTVTYNNSSQTPTTAPRLITFVAHDGTRDSNVAAATVAVGSPGDAPAPNLAARDGSCPSGAILTTAFTEGGQPPPVADGDAPLLDLDADNSSGWKGADFGTTFMAGGEPVPVADGDAVLSGVDGAKLTSLVVSITNRLDAGKLAYYNQEVKKGDFLAEIDPKIYQAAVARDQATLSTRLAEVERVRALLKQAEAEERRAGELKRLEEQYRSEADMEEVKFISDTELDQITANCASLEAQLKVAQAAIKQAEAGLENSVANLNYTKITSPVDGIIIDRKIDEGQTLAAQFQTPELFVVAPDMRRRMHVIALVDEADIGMILKAERQDRPVDFTVDAYPDDVFKGEILQVRMNSTTLQNVVTYPVVVEVPNPELKLLPGMTATLSFETDRHKDVLKIPNAALRFYPKPDQVRPEDRKLLEGTDDESDSGEQADGSEEQRSAAQRAAANRKRNRKHVWVLEGEQLRAVEVTLGLSDFKWTELVSGDVKEGQKLVTGVGPRKP